MIIPDPISRTIHLRVKLNGDKVTLEDGSPLPKLRADAKAQLVILAAALTDPEELKKLTLESSVKFLPQGTTLWARIKPKSGKEPKSGGVQLRDLWPGGRGLFAAILLKEELRMRLRSGKYATLCDCECEIPALGKIARSVNEAYTQISVGFEPDRRSHTGNVFQCVYAERKDGKLEPLDSIRDRQASDPVIDENPQGTQEQLPLTK